MPIGSFLRTDNIGKNWLQIPQSQSQQIVGIVTFLRVLGDCSERNAPQYDLNLRFMHTATITSRPPSAQARPRRSDPSGPLTFASIGVSGYAGILLDCLEPLIENGEASLIAATVRTRSKAAVRCEQIEQRGGCIFTDWQAMVDAVGDGLDCLIVPTGIQDHCKMAVYALERDINVLLEKPIAATLGEAHAILEAAERSEAGLILGYQDLYTDSTHAIKALLQEGVIGSIESINVLCLWPRKDDYFARNSWAGRLRIDETWVLDSPVNNAMGHFINLPLFWLGEGPLESASVERLSGSLYRSRELESFDTAAIQLDTAAGIRIYFHGSHACEAFIGPEIRIVGSEGSIHWVADQHYTVHSAKGIQTVPLISTMDARRLLMQNTSRWLTDQAVHLSTAEQALQQTRVVHMLHSGIKIRTVPVDLIQIDGGKRVLKGIDDAFKKCFANARLLSPCDVSWAGPIQSVEWQSVCHLTEPTL
jgi:predicted dehydrogenase